MKLKLTLLYFLFTSSLFLLLSCGDDETKPKDSDGDGIADNVDLCPDTPTGETVNIDGCSLSQLDSDGDGITDDIDICPDTPTGETVDLDGCSSSQLDSDGDGITDDVDTIYEYEFTPSESTDPDGYAHYKIYIPETVDTIKGVYCFVPGWQGSSLSMIDVGVFHKTFVEKHGLVLMGFKMLGSYTDYYGGVSLWSGEALIKALKELSIISRHPELEYAAMLFDGHSAGGQFSYHFTQYKPERVIAFVTMKGGYHSLSAAGDAINVPGYMFIGEDDLDYRIDNLSTIFKTNRPNGALWSIAMEPNAGHDRVSLDIIHSYFDEIIPLRVPQKIPFDTIPSLIKLQDHTGWLGNPDTYIVNKFSEYQDDIGGACWFPNEKIALEWQGFVDKNTTTNNGRYQDEH